MLRGCEMKRKMRRRKLVHGPQVRPSAGKRAIETTDYQHVVRGVRSEVKMVQQNMVDKWTKVEE